MTFLLGVVLFAVGIGISVALHEAGHMYSAKAFGMKVRRYFIGFGPTLFSFRRGETEYGLKAIPGGGFCDIAGMTALDELPDPSDRKRAFYRFATWKRVIVLSAGSMMHFVLGLFVVYTMLITTGAPNPSYGEPVVGEVSPCIGVAPGGGCPAGAPAPARAAGLQAGDRVLSVAGVPVATFSDMSRQTQQRSGPTAFRVDRQGQVRTVTVDVTRVPLSSLTSLPVKQDQLVGAIGVAPVDRVVTYGAAAAVPGAFTYTGALFGQTWEGLKQFPSKVPLLLDRIGGQDQPDTPISVVGASILGGDAADAGLWIYFLYLLAAFNLFIGVFNLLPLLPLDGGHISVNLYERARNILRHLRGRPDGPPVDYTKLLPLTYAVLIVFIGISALTITADIVNPIRLR